MRPWTVIVFAVLLGIVLAAASCGHKAEAAPAPLIKREPRRTPCPLPISCLMKFCDIPYAATFRPDGNYEASRADWGESKWVGSWSLSRNAEGAVLVIHERLDGGDFWLLHTIPLYGDLRRGKDTWEGRFTLE